MTYSTNDSRLHWSGLFRSVLLLGNIGLLASACGLCSAPESTHAPHPSCNAAQCAVLPAGSTAEEPVAPSSQSIQEPSPSTTTDATALWVHQRPASKVAAHPPRPKVPAARESTFEEDLAALKTPVEIAPAPETPAATAVTPAPAASPNGLEELHADRYPPGTVVRGTRPAGSDPALVGGDFRLVSVVYFLNGRRILMESKPRANARFEVPAQPGTNTVRVLAVAEGIGRFPTLYLKDVMVTLDASRTFEAHAEDRASIQVTASDDHNLLERMEDRIHLRVEATVRGPESAALDVQRR